MDFFSKNKSGSTSAQDPASSTQGDDSSIQDITNLGTPAVSNYTKVNYPLPSTDIPQVYDASVAQAQTYPDSTDNNELATPVVPANAMADLQPQTSEPADITDYTYSTPSNQPAAQTPVEPVNAVTSANDEGIQVTTYDEPQADNSTTNIEPIAPLAQTEMPSEATQGLNTDLSAQINNLASEPVVEPTQQVITDQPVAENTVTDNLQIETPAQTENTPITPNEPADIMNNDALNINASEVVQPAVTENVTDPSMFTELETNPAAETVTEPTKEMETAQTDHVSNPELAQMQDQIEQVAVEVPEVAASDSINKLDSSNTHSEETKSENEVSNVSEIGEDTSYIKFEIFKKIGFVGLNVENPDTKIIQELKTLTTSLTKAVNEIVVDSSKGYGNDVLNIAAKSDVNITGVYLKPYYTNFSDEADNFVNVEKYTTVVYSNFIEKLENIAKVSDIFIIPQTAGVNNLSELFTLWSIEHLYLGQHKPIILLGENWENLLTTMKSNFNISDSELSTVNIAKTAEEALNLIVKLDHEYSSKKSLNFKKVIDKRGDSDESGFFISK